MARTPTTWEHAIVIGAGMAGLLAARVLIEHFEQVTLIERDHFPAGPEFRPGVPQGRHPHVMLLRGQQILEQLFPGITAKLLAHGAVQCDFLNDVLFVYPSGRGIRFPSNQKGWTCTRSLVEWQVRQELQSFMAIRMVEGHEVVGLLTSSDKRRVTGVRVRERKQTIEEPVDMTADFIVDASGRSSHTPQWLQNLGYPAPAETILDTGLEYASRFYTPPAPDRLPDWKGCTIQGKPDNLRGGVVWPVEGGRWLVLLAGIGNIKAPTKEEQFLPFAQQMYDPAIYEAIKDAEPISPIYGYRQTANRLLHYERLPDGFVTLGDSFCAFNPIYGQGMAVAAMGALTLDRILRDYHRQGLYGTGLPLAFQRRLERTNALPWQVASSSDYSLLGKKMENSGWMARYFEDVVTQLVPTDKLARKAFFDVVNLTGSPALLFHPLIVLQLLRRRMRQRPAQAEVA
ncbi:MAG: FAD-dependent monooxygenase [Ktedonobacteraceae bacterium]|nr:FAD-dependent monooxygenase [Ktedonobacteraceae bacterium]